MSLRTKYKFLMESEDAANHEELFEDRSEQLIQTKLLVVSSHDDLIKIHTNISWIKDCSFEHLI